MTLATVQIAMSMALLVLARRWSPDMSDEDLLARLLDLNLARAADRGGLPADATDDADQSADDE